MALTIDYYLSLASPWSYLGHQRLINIANSYDYRINVHAVDLSVILPATGGIPLPKRSQQRKDYRMQELKRWRDYLKLPLNCQDMVVLNIELTQTLPFHVLYPV